MSAAALLAAETALLDERRRLTRAEVLDVAGVDLDALPDLIALAHKVRVAWCGEAVELESLVNAKSGACPEDCAFCSQSVAFETDVDVYPYMDQDDIVAAAKATAAAGATQFCIVVAVRGPSERLLDKVIESVGRVRDEVGLDVACSVGLLDEAQAARLAAAGVKRYNHNLEAPRAIFAEVCTTHTYEDRIDTARIVQGAGMELCCGGILGMGESLEQRVDFAFELAELAPVEVPLNFLNPRPGTALAGVSPISAREALQAIALFRLALPDTVIRLAGGRELVLGELQALGMLAGANALIVGNYLTTLGRAPEEDLALLESLGMPVDDGLGEGQYIVEASGVHVKAAGSPRTSRSIPVAPA